MPRRVIALALALSACDAEVVLHFADGGVDAGERADAPSDALDHRDAPDALACSAPDASACEACIAVSCCEVRSTCETAATCPCIVACVLSGDGDEAACGSHCGADGGEHVAVLSCAHDLCMPACP